MSLNNNISLINLNSQFNPFYSSINIDSSGNVGIGKSNPSEILDVSGNIKFSGNIIGSGYHLTSLNATNITSGVLSVNRGGTGATTLTAGSILVGNGTSTLIQPSNLTWNTGTNTLSATNFVGSGAGLTSLNATNITGNINVAQGGTGLTTLTTGQLLVGNGTSALTQSANLVWDNTNNRLGIGITNPQYILDIQGVQPTLRLLDTRSDGNAIISLNEFTDNYGYDIAYIGNTDNKLYIRGYNNSATPRIDMTFDRTTGNVGIGTTTPNTKLDVNGNISLKSDSASSLFWSGTLTSLGRANGSGDFSSSAVAGDLVLRSVGKLILQSGTGIGAIVIDTSNNINIDSGILYIDASNNNVGIGTTQPNKKLHVTGDTRIEGSLIVNGTVTQINTNVGTTEQLLITNDGTGPALIVNQTGAQPIIEFQDDGSTCFKIFDGGNLGIGTASKVVSVDISGNLKLSGSITGSGSGLSALNASNITGNINVAQGGTGLTTLTSGQLLIGGANVIQTANLTWDNTNNRLGIGKTNPTTTLDVNGTVTSTLFIGSGASLSSLTASNITGNINVAQGGTGLTTLTSGQLLIGGTNVIQTPNLIWNSGTNTLSATNFVGSGAGLTALNATNITGNINVAQGGTGLTTLTSGQLLIGGTNVIQTPNLIWNSGSNTLSATNFVGSGTGLTALNASNITGNINVAQGGTGLTTLTSGQILVGNGTGALLQSANLTWDNTNNRLGIGITNPSSVLDVTGNINFTGFLYKNNVLFAGGLSQGMTVQTKHLTYTQMDVKNNIGWEPINDDLSTGFVISITPTNSASKILINMIAHIGCVMTGDNRWWGIKLYRKIDTGNWTEVTAANGTETGAAATTVGTPCWITNNQGMNDNLYNYFMSNSTGTFLDAPNTTSIVYYTAYWNNRIGDGATATSSSMYINRAENMNDAYRPATSSSWTASEIWDLGTPYIPPAIDNTITISSGNVGINASPNSNYKLIINYGTSGSTGITCFPLKISAGAYSNFGNLTATLIGFGTENNTWAKCAIGHCRTGTYDIGSIVFCCNSIADGTNVSMSNEKMRITDSGNVGIGKTNPATILDINGTTTSTLFSGSGASLSSLNASNINAGTLTVSNGGTGLTTLTAGQLLIGGANVVQSANLTWNSGTNTLLATNFVGSGTGLTALNATNITGNINVAQGGTGLTTLTSGQILIGGANVIQTPNLIWNSGTNTLSATNFVGSGSGLSALNASNINSGTLTVSNGGTGLTTLTAGQILIGGTNVTQTANLTWDNTNNRLGIGITTPNANLHLHGNGASQNVRISFSDNTSGVATTDGFCIGKDTLQVGYIYNTENNALSIGTNNTERMRIEANGNIGIGKTPGYMLDVNGTINCTADMRVGGDWYWQASKNMYLQTSTNNFEWSMDMLNQNTYTGCYWQVWSDKTGLGSILACRGDTGNVGIRNTAPGYALDVAGDINITGSFRVNGTAFSSSSSQWTTAGSNIHYNSGNIGIGTTVINEKLTISGTSGRHAMFINTTTSSSSYVGFSNSANDSLAYLGVDGIGLTNYVYGALTLGTWKDKPILFTTGSTNTEKMRIDSNGNVYIGSSTNSSDDNNASIAFPDSTFYVRGPRTAASTTNIVFRGGLEGNNNGKVRLWFASDAAHASYIENEHTTSGNTILMFGTSSGNALPTERMRIGSDGTITTNNNNINAGSGTITAATFSGNATTATTATSASGLTGTPNITVGTVSCSSITGSGQINQITNTTDGEVRLGIRNNSSGVNAYTAISAQNAAGNSFVMFLNSSTRTVDGGVNTATLRNDIGDLRLSAASNSPFIYLKSSNGNVGIGTTNPTTAKLVITGTAGAIGLDMSTTDQYAEMRVIRNSLSSLDKHLYLNLGSGTTAAEIKLYSNSTEIFKVGNTGVSFAHSYWHSSLDGLARLYFSNADRTYIRGHGSTPIEFRNASDTTIATISSTGNLNIVGNEIYIGPDSGSSRIFLGGGAAGDTGHSLSVIESRNYASTEKTELLLFKGNDGDASSGPDRIRLRAAAIAFDTYTPSSSDRTAESIRMYINPDGNVGIGNLAPTGPLCVGNSQLSGSNGFIVIGKNNGAGGSRSQYIGYNSTFDLVIGDYSGGTGPLVEAFKLSYAAPANSMIINSGGSVGIGRTPGYRLDVEGSICARNEWLRTTGLCGLYSDTYACHFYPNDAQYGNWRIHGNQANGWSGLRFTDAEITVMAGNNGTKRCGFHYNTGTVGWGFYIDENRDAFCPGNITAYWSDRRLKKNLSKLSNFDNVLTSLTGYSFNWNEKGQKILSKSADELDIGLIAQDVQKVIPQAVRVNKAGMRIDEDESSFDYLTIHYDKIIPFLVEGYKHHKDIIEKQNKEIEILKQENNDLKQKYDNLLQDMIIIKKTLKLI
jgi:hypothetical protein